MSLSAPSPPESSSSQSSSQRNSAQTSPETMSTELGVDPSDPFNLLMQHNSDSSMDDSSTGESPPDWSQLSSLWPNSSFDSTFGAEGNQKPFTEMDFSMGLSSDFDFVSSMAIDPNALQFDNQKMGYPTYDFTPNDPMMGQSFPFTFQTGSPLSVSSNGAQQQRRLSVTSSSSSSGASLSPIVESRSPSIPVQEPKVPNTDNAADELAQRVRQSAGVMWAVPMNAQMQNAPTSSPTSSSQMPTPTSTSSPIPMLAPSPNAFLSSASSVSSAASTPPPTTPPPPTSTQTLETYDKAPVADHSAYASASGSSMSVLPRPKTSHTTIERRYRTNLNARIMSLRMAVPALRVLEDREGTGVGGGGKKSKGKNSTLGRNVVFGTKVKRENEDGTEFEDVIDERGFVDGVKVARKCSKANVLGKAVEYIRVLKKRELRLKREQEGLKSLISGLVGGPALLREWEREWKERFGGEEKDEVDGEDPAMQDDGSDDEGGSGDDDDDDEGGRKRKKPKVIPPPAPVVKKEPKEKKPAPPPPQPQTQVLPDGTVITIVPEKRKRGRPRKVVPPPVTAAPVPAPPATAVGGDQTMYVQPQPPVQQQHAQPAQYLLATFALFSFFNNPFTSSASHPPPNHTHTGHVVSQHHNADSNAYSMQGWSLTGMQMHDVIQAFHLLVSALVFLSIVLPWLPIPSKYFSLSYLSSSFKSYRARPASTPISTKPRSRSASLVAALAPAKRGTAEEVAGLRGALGGRGFSSMLQGMLKRNNKENAGFEQKGLQQRAWVRVGEICVLEGETSTLNRALTWWHMRSHLSWFTASAADLSTLALVAWPLGRFARKHACAVWDAARARKGPSGDRDGGINVQVRAHERLVLESMDVDEAVERLKDLKKKAGPELHRYSPIGVLAWMLVRTRIKHHLEVMFVKAVLPRENVYELEDADAKPAVDICDETEDDERRKTIEAARSLGGKMAELGDILQKVGTMGVWELDDLASLSDDEESDEEEGREPSLDTEIKVLLNALILYRQIFSSSILDSTGYGGPGVSILLSPPPSPGSKDMKLQYELRRLLGSSVFDVESGTLGEVLEDARDRVVDMLVESERAGR